MKYFISKSIYTFNSGTEHTQANRTRLFNQHKNFAAYVTRDYNRLWMRDASRVGLKPDEVINMYDYFQGTRQVTPKSLPLRQSKSIPLDEYQVVDHGPDYSTIDQAGRTLARINVLPETIGLVGDIEYYDRFDQLVSRDNFDWRGFKSSIDYFHPDGQLAVRRYLDLAGRVVLENIYMNVDGHIQPTMWKLIDFNGRDYRFDTEDQLFLFFLNQLLLETEHNILVSDHRELDYVVADVKNAEGKWVAFHGSHVDKHGNPFADYGIALEARSQDFTGIIVSSIQQKKVIEQSFPELRVAVASDVLNLNLDSNSKVQSKITKRIIFSGRLEDDKRPLDALEVFRKVAKEVPDAILEFRGYTNDFNLLTTLKRTAEEYKLNDKVIFGDYLTDKEMVEFYKRGQILIETANNEAGGMVIGEALQAGVPVVSYDIDYGISNLIKNGVNGYIVTNGDQAQMARRIVQILTDSSLYQKMQKEMFIQAKKNNSEQIYDTWNEILE